MNFFGTSGKVVIERKHLRPPCVCTCVTPDPWEPAVLVSHSAVRGSPAASSSGLDDAKEMLLEPACIGHILGLSGVGSSASTAGASCWVLHRLGTQAVFCRMDERHDRKSVVLFEIQARHVCDPPQVLALQSPPLSEVEMADPDVALPMRAQKYRDAQEA